MDPQAMNEGWQRVMGALRPGSGDSVSQAMFDMFAAAYRNSPEEIRQAEARHRLEEKEERLRNERRELQLEEQRIALEERKRALLERKAGLHGRRRFDVN